MNDIYNKEILNFDELIQYKIDELECMIGLGKDGIPPEQILEDIYILSEFIAKVNILKFLIKYEYDI